MFFRLDNAVAAVADAFAVARTSVILLRGIFFSGVTSFAIFKINLVKETVSAIMGWLTERGTVAFMPIIYVPVSIIAGFIFIQTVVSACRGCAWASEGFAFPSVLNDTFLASVIGIVVSVVTFFAIVILFVATRIDLCASVFGTRPSVFDLAFVVASV